MSYLGVQDNYYYLIDLQAPLIISDLYYDYILLWSSEHRKWSVDSFV